MPTKLKRLALLGAEPDGKVAGVSTRSALVATQPALRGLPWAPRRSCRPSQFYRQLLGPLELLAGAGSVRAARPCCRRCARSIARSLGYRRRLFDAGVQAPPGDALDNRRPLERIVNARKAENGIAAGHRRHEPGPASVSALLGSRRRPATRRVDLMASGLVCHASATTTGCRQRGAAALRREWRPSEADQQHHFTPRVSPGGRGERGVSPSGCTSRPSPLPFGRTFERTGWPTYDHSRLLAQGPHRQGGSRSRSRAPAATAPG